MESNSTTSRGNLTAGGIRYLGRERKRERNTVRHWDGNLAAHHVERGALRDSRRFERKFARRNNLGISNVSGVRLCPNHPDNRMLSKPVLLSAEQRYYHLQASGLQSPAGTLRSDMHHDVVYFGAIFHAQRSMGDSASGSGLSWRFGVGSNGGSRGPLVDGASCRVTSCPTVASEPGPGRSLRPGWSR